MSGLRTWYVMCLFLQVLVIEIFLQARQTATLEMPPVSAHFDQKQRIYPPKATRSKATSEGSEDAPTIPSPTPNPGPVPTVTPSIVELLMVNLLQQQQAQLRFINPQPQQLSESATVVSTPPSPNKLRHRVVTLDEFCNYYSVSTADRERLEKLEYTPGDAINKLEREDWQGQASFSKLAWTRMLEKHQAFLKDIRNGVWA